jgi:hypothetical protein
MSNFFFIVCFFGTNPPAARSSDRPPKRCVHVSVMTPKRSVSVALRKHSVMNDVYCARNTTRAQGCDCKKCTQNLHYCVENKFRGAT